MPPTIYAVRHAQGYHNIANSSHLRDPHLTELGHQQCQQLRESFPFHDDITLVVASPLLRTIETAFLSFRPAFEKNQVPMVLNPLAQEISSNLCDVGHDPQELESEIEQFIVVGGMHIEKDTIEKSLVEPGWNSKSGIYAASLSAVEKRAAALRSWLWKRPEKSIVLVTHGGFLHYFAQDWTGFDDLRDTAWENCEYRRFEFTADSNERDAHVEEHGKAGKIKQGRPAGVNANILAGVEEVEGAQLAHKGEKQ